MQRFHLALVQSLFCLALLFRPAYAETPPEAQAAGMLVQGISYRQQGEIQQSIDLLIQAQHAAHFSEMQIQATGELGISLLQAHRYESARLALEEAYRHVADIERARYAVYLGNLAVIEKHKETARVYYQEALTAAGGNADIHFSASLDLIKLAPVAERLPQLNTLAPQLEHAEGLSQADLARYHLNLGNQARQLGGNGLFLGLSLAYHQLEQARRIASGLDNKRLLIEALDTLAQLYEDQGRQQDASSLNDQGLAIAQAQRAGMVADLLINLEWRQGRLSNKLGNDIQALAAYQQAVSQIEAVRQDIPIEYEDGTSSFQTTLEPIYHGYADLLLRQADRQAPENRAGQLAQVRDTIELIRQTEMQDFLGDRCIVESVHDGAQTSIKSGVAVLYPLIFPDRIELLLDTPQGLIRRTSNVDGVLLRRTVTSFSEKLRDGLDNYESDSHQLYNWLLRPFDSVFSGQQLHSLVVVPDGVLRLVPISALSDGKQYAIEKYAVSMVTGLSMTNMTAPVENKGQALVAGVSRPGSVVEKLDALLGASMTDIAQPDSGNQTRGLITRRNMRQIQPPQHELDHPSNDQTDQTLEKLRVRLELPGAESEVNALKSILHGAGMLNAEFTVGHFNSKIEYGNYRIIHIASHGIFGGSAETSFIMAYDDVINMTDLQNLLETEQLKKMPIELLSLSACETAEGNDRSPLGISGVAIKAHAKSVLGTIWPVEDNAAHEIMVGLYGGMINGKLSKTEALRQAQIAMLHNPDTAHPFYWAPFVLIGNWL